MKYNELSDKLLIEILKEIDNRIDEEYLAIDVSHYELSDIYYVDNLDLLCDILKYFGLKLDNSDIVELSYFIQLWNTNQNYVTNKIDRPKLNNYEFVYEETARVLETKEYRNYINLYGEIDSQLLYEFQSDGLIDMYYGEVINTHSNYVETINEEIAYIKKI